MVPPPGLYSVTTGCFQAACRRSATMRAMVSVGPPGAKGTISFTGLLGQGSACAWAIRGAAASVASTLRRER
jgi:hypothetical protein